MADEPKSPEPPTPPVAAADKASSATPGEPLKAEVSRTDAPGAGASAAPVGEPSEEPPAPKPANPAAAQTATISETSSATGQPTAPAEATPPAAPKPAASPAAATPAAAPRARDAGAAGCGRPSRARTRSSKPRGCRSRRRRAESRTASAGTARPAERTNGTAAAGDRHGARIYHVPANGSRRGRRHGQLLHRRLDGDRAGRARARCGAPSPHRARRVVRLLLGRHRHGLAAAQRGPLRRDLLPLFDTPAARAGGEDTRQRGPADRVGHRRVAGGELARARGLRHVRREFHQPSRSPPHPDAGRLAGLPAAEGLSARRSRRTADGKPRRLVEAAPGARAGRH